MSYLLSLLSTTICILSSPRASSPTVVVQGTEQDREGTVPFKVPIPYSSRKVQSLASQPSISQTAFDAFLSLTIKHEHVAFLQDRLQRIHHLVETAGGSFLLRELHDTQIRLATPFENRIQKCVEMNRFQLQICPPVSMAA